MNYQLIEKPEKGIWFVLYTLRPFSSYPHDYSKNDVLRDVEGRTRLFTTGSAACKFSKKLNDGFEHPALQIRKVQKVKLLNSRSSGVQLSLTYLSWLILFVLYK
jgi:hypothetical protein